MSVQTSHKTTTTTYRTMNVASPEPTTTTYRTLSVGSPEPVAAPAATSTAYRTVSVASQDSPTAMIAAANVSTLPYAVNGSYDVRYLMPMQQQQYVYLQQPMVQQMVQPMVQPVYLQSVQSVQSVPHLSVSSGTIDSSDLVYQQRQTLESVSGKSSVFSQSSSPIKSPELSVEEVEEEEEEESEEEEAVEVEEVEIVNVIQQRPPPLIERTVRTEIKSSPALIDRISRTEVSSSLREVPQPTKLDTRYFGELLAEVYRKNCDIHSCISENVSKMKGKKMDTFDLRVDRDEVEALIPKGATELTKQQMRYLLQTRLTADKSMRLLLSTFSSLREELLHMSEDLRRLEGEKESLERDLSFRADQAKQYDTLLENVRENNRQLQSSLKDVTASQRSLESQLMSSKSSDSSREFKMKDLEGRLRALEKENEMLRQKLAGQASGATLQKKTEELSQQYNEQLSSMREEKDREIEKLRSQMSKMQTKITSTSSTQSSSERSLQLKISELLAQLEQRQSTISRQESEIRRLLSERNDSSKNVTKTIITKRYRNQYPILGLLSDDYQVTSPTSVKEDRTIVIERSGEMVKQE